MTTIEEELKKFVQEVYKIIKHNQNQSDNTKITEIKKYVERAIKSWY